MHHTNTHKAAFSLVELMFVLAIMAVLAGVVAFNLKGQADRAKIETTQMGMQTIAQALEMYEVRHNEYPPNGIGLQALVSDQQFKAVPQDAWKHDFSYVFPAPGSNGDAYELMSAGKDGQWNTGDEILFDPHADQ